MYVWVVEQVRGPPDLRQNIIAAAKQERKIKERDFSGELQMHECVYGVQDKYVEATVPQTHGTYPHLDRKSFIFNETLIKISLRSITIDFHL